MNKTILATILTAFGASLCCTGPLLVLLFGSTAFGAFGFFEHILPYTTVLTFGLVAIAYFKVFFRKQNSDCCESDKESIMNKQKKQKRLLLMVTPVIIGLVLFPYYGDILYGQSPKTEVQKTVSATEWNIEGMTCEGCAKGLEGGLAATNGITSCQVDYTNESMVCALDESVIHQKDIPELVEKMGYKAKLKTTSDKKLSKAGFFGASNKSCRLENSCCTNKSKTI